MLQLLPQSDTLIPQTMNPREAVTFINNYIEKYHCKMMNVDISFMNMLDACYVSTLCSTRHYIKYPDGKISWRIASESVENLSKRLELGNSEFILQDS